MKLLKHILKYLFSPTYRFYSNFYDQQEFINKMNRQMIQMKEYHARKKFELMYPEESKIIKGK